MKKFFLTGGFGFIGSHLAENFVREGYKVVVFDRYNSDNYYGWLDKSPLLDDLEIIMGDIRDYDSVSKAMDGCTHVFHLAALIGIPYSYVSPLAYIKTNVQGTYNILEASKNLSLDQVLITSTSETYGTAQYVPINEKHPFVGQSPYSASKISADQLAISYFHSFDLPVKIVRPFNTYGPRQSARAIIPTIITQILSGEKEIYLGSLKPTRDLTYVLDTCNGFLEIMKSDKLFGSATNIGMNKEASIGELVKMIVEITGSEVKILKDKNRIRPKNSEVFRLVCDNSKIINETDWKPKYNLEDGLSETIDWMKLNKNYFKSRYTI